MSVKTTAVVGPPNAKLPAVVSATEAQVTAGKRLVAEEVREKGAVSWRTYAAYCRAGGGVFFAVFIVAVFVVAATAKGFSDWWLAYWLGQGDGAHHSSATTSGRIQDNPHLDMYNLVYAMSAVVILVVQLFRSYLFVRASLHASTSLHWTVFNAIVRAPMSFFDSTPTGRILNRFSSDLDAVDVQLPSGLEVLMQNITLLALALGMVAWTLPWFLLPLIPIILYFRYMVRYFSPAQLELKRLDNTTRSPLISLLTATFQGLNTIHAYHKGEEFQQKFAVLLNRNSQAFFGFNFASRWFAYRLDLVSVMMMASTAALAVILRKSLDPEQIALALLYTSSTSGVLQFTTRMLAEVEARFTSVQRIHAYGADLPQEQPEFVPATDPPASWPEHGRIELRDLEIKYRPELPSVLQHLTLTIEGCSRIGIAGRTGSGKSTLATALFRLLEPTHGAIIIDGVDISTIGLTTLRSRLSIIPQDPVLFIGTLRYNLDPFDECSDSAVWSAINHANLSGMMARLPDGLHTPVVENGDNFSVGERQLLCLARALLRDSKILILDEATSAADTNTDQAIQNTIRENFVGKRTLLTIAHRLDTIADYDKILVLDGGQVLEFDTPQNLLANPRSAFATMMHESRLH